MAFRHLARKLRTWDISVGHLLSTMILQVYNSELNCLGTVRGGDKVVAGAGSGNLYLFSKWADL